LIAEVLAAQVFREIVGRGAWGGPPHALASQLGGDGLYLKGSSCKTPWRAASGCPTPPAGQGGVLTASTFRNCHRPTPACGIAAARASAAGKSGRLRSP